MVEQMIRVFEISQGIRSIEVERGQGNRKGFIIKQEHATIRYEVSKNSKGKIRKELLYWARPCREAASAKP
jgi:hypothetical protein